ncbi:sensor domain-containing phosphodiesterase [Futiania mangrovi]|uniref:EAL domain-containing protein n=1 Tax=Futiania mangrovi TaxID=2959716 RepID=A0A9J6PMR4_9PROT|nr:EAL domain-containing protein [Futiania mangrovii]MCP1337354.1 EAL domain-containing protein [Futiania mangrovii]
MAAERAEQEREEASGGMRADLRLQRDRFLAFAFASADLLIELDGDHRVTYALGAAQQMFGCAADALVGRAFCDLLAAADRGMARAALDGIAIGERFGPFAVQLDRTGDRSAGPAMVATLGGSRMPPREDRICLCLSRGGAAARPVGARGGKTADAPSLAGTAQRMLQETLTRIADFKAAVRDKQIRLVCHPIVDLATGETQHYEILSRFLRGENTHAMVSFAEDVGIIEDLDLAIAESAVDLLTRFLPARADGQGTRLAVNVSGHSLRSAMFVDLLMDLLKGHAGLAGRLVFELTDSAAIDDRDQVGSVLRDIRALGFGVCLDDFGGDAAAFGCLQAFDVDYIKIEGGFVRGLGPGGRERHMIRSMASLARSLGVRSIAEHVETAQQRDVLKELGVDFGQGYLFGQPEPVSRLVREQEQTARKSA